MVSLNLIVVVLFLLACIAPYLNTETWWILGFLALMIPYLVVALILFVIFWGIVKPLIALLPLLCLLLGFQQLKVIFAWTPGPSLTERKRENQLRVVDWNLQSFNGLSKNRETKKHVRTEVAASILKLSPDIICLQEFNHADKSGEEADNLSLFKKQYPYYFFSRDYRRSKGAYQSGCIIFSRYPILDTGRVVYPVAESLIFADVLKGEDTIRIFTTHLQSFKFKKEDYSDLDKIRSQEDENLAASRNIVRKMKLAFQRRGRQAVLVRNALDQSPYPALICGDFNDVPGSFTYSHIRDGWQDAFLRKGFAVGRTFISLAPTLRIDYILASPAFEVKTFDMVDEGLSDHIMLVSDLQLKK